MCLTSSCGVQDRGLPQSLTAGRIECCHGLIPISPGLLLWHSPELHDKRDEQKNRHILWTKCLYSKQASSCCAALIWDAGQRSEIWTVVVMIVRHFCSQSWKRLPLHSFFFFFHLTLCISKIPGTANLGSRCPRSEFVFAVF